MHSVNTQYSGQVAEWSYKVFPADKNYNQRDDKVNDFFKLDSNESWQIEMHYKDCNSGKNNYGDIYTIAGDQGKVRT